MGTKEVAKKKINVKINKESDAKRRFDSEVIAASYTLNVAD